MSDLRMMAGRLPTMQGISEQYKKTFAVMQIMIGVVALAVLIRTQRLVAALAFFAMMQLGAIVGAMWASSLKSRIERARSGRRG